MDRVPSGLQSIGSQRVGHNKSCSMSGSNLDSILKSRDITLPTNVCLVKAMVFPWNKSVVPCPVLTVAS